MKAGPDVRRILQPYSPVLSGLFDFAFVLCGGGQADSFAAQSLNTEFICMQITNNKPLRAPFANKRALFLSHISNVNQYPQSFLFPEECLTASPSKVLSFP